MVYRVEVWAGVTSRSSCSAVGYRSCLLDATCLITGVMFVLPNDETRTCCKTRASEDEKAASNIPSIEDAQLYAIGELSLVTRFT
jgi:hypothetical protein